ncbi:MAG: hypothetical protein A3E36_01375 [Candidatus Andersenbacteria bacterium RIFCSPHIGHO2_12_FULL_45_11b]|uniref:V-type proton ATPase subunit E n=1 Tax=Candidatus Andersenbacteria bacterium RIFCSPHIGHO2_12_FULL_45_11b TaxID=1797282 RepID=A0A1G1XB76_9BACT|nr:MAG: hypothetical protein A3E36_01375 [Candidatus Andersenbacteria bacterium RIFCSPHIGHO2_12_FULL_45_11b]
MSLSALKEAIVCEAAAQAEAIAKQAASAVQQEQQRTTKELRELEESIVQRARVEGERQARMIHQKAELAGRALILRAKQKEIASTKDAFVSYLAQLPDAQSKALYQELLNKLPGTSGEIIAGEKSKAIVEKLTTKHHAISKETLPDEGGFIFRSKHVEINSTFSYLAEKMFWNHRADIAKELFS